MEDVGINPVVLKWFEDRGISHETVIRGGVYSGSQQDTGVEPDEEGQIIVYPFFRHGEVVNRKYRGANKRFWQDTGGEKVFWNADVLDDPSLQDGTQSLVITEGENDCLAVMEAGHPFVVSVPDGAPPARKGPRQDDDIQHDDKYGYVFNDWESLKKIKHIVIAADNDESGKRLAEELVRRLGRVRCRFVEYPQGSKDLNEVLVEHGPDTVLEIIQAAKSYPVSGIYTLEELPPEPDLEPMSTGWGRMDHLIKPYFPAFMVVTGTANAGKSTWVNQMAAQMNIRYGCKVALASFEMRINPFISESLMAVHTEHSKGDARKWLNDNFVFICPEPCDDNDNFDINWLIEKAEAAVIRYGIRILIIDPWNEIEHAISSREKQTDYIGRAIRALKRFGREFECLVVVVAHPSKYGAAKAEKDPPEKLSLYDISDTAHFANKADIGVVVGRYNNGTETEVSVVKIRYQPMTGTIGSLYLSFCDKTRIFGA